MTESVKPGAKLKILQVGTKDEIGQYTGWAMSAEGVDDPAPAFELADDGSLQRMGGYTLDELDAIIAQYTDSMRRGR